MPLLPKIKRGKKPFATALLRPRGGDGFVGVIFSEGFIAFEWLEEEPTHTPTKVMGMIVADVKFGALPADQKLLGKLTLVLDGEDHGAAFSSYPPLVLDFEELPAGVAEAA